MSIDGATKQYIYVDWWCDITVCCMSIYGAT